MTEESTAVPKSKIEDSKFYKDIIVQEPTWREKTASRIAYGILGLFGVSLIVSFCLGYKVVSNPTTGNIDEKAIESSLAYLKAVGTMFTPLLAFILGYYFTKKEE